MKVIIIEGLIGSGKTTLTRDLAQHAPQETLFLLEPDEKDNANPYLERYYRDPHRWAFTMQAHLLSARFRMHQLAQWHTLSKQGHAILDRSYFGDTCFAKVQLKNGYMTEEEYNTYASLYRSMTASVMLPSICIRLETSPETCNKRISKRMEAETGRACESAISTEYLRDLDDEISAMVNILEGQGVYTIRVPYDEDLTTQERYHKVILPILGKFEEQTTNNLFHKRIV